MPYVKSISVHTSPKKTIIYILNDDKTENLTYVAGINIGATAENAYEQFKTVYEHYSKHSFEEKKAVNSKTPVKLFHFVQSFRPTDEITPELANSIAQEWAKKAFGNERQILIATHVDKGHIHSHVLINPYDLNGRKFNSNKKNLEAVRALSDSISQQYGIEPIPDKKNHKSVSYKEWDERRKGTSWKQTLKEHIDRLVYDVQSIDELYKKLSEIGYQIRRGKHTTVTVPTSETEKKKSVRIDNVKSFGEGYSEEDLEQRIDLAKKQKIIDEEQKKAEQISKMGMLERLYTRRIYEVGQLVRNGTKTAKKYNKKLPYSVENDYEIYHLAMQLQVIKRDDIKSIEGLERMMKDVQNAYEDCRKQFTELDHKEQQFKLIIDNAEQYFSLKSKPENQLTPSEKLKLQMSENVVRQCGLKSPSDIERVRQLYSKNAAETAALKKRFEALETRYREYADIAYRYKNVSRKDYISKLIEEKKRTTGKLE